MGYPNRAPKACARPDKNEIIHNEVMAPEIVAILMALIVRSEVLARTQMLEKEPIMAKMLNPMATLDQKMNDIFSLCTHGVSDC